MSSANVTNDDAATLSTKAEVENELGDNQATVTAVPAPERGAGFWLVFFAICLALFVSALDAVRFATAGPVPADSLMHATHSS
jgi:putative Ca2+/H+ antiporter (TMEM165/GDT1 family)